MENFIKGYCEGWDCVGHCVEDGEETHIVRNPSGSELQLCSSCLADYRKDYPAVFQSALEAPDDTTGAFDDSIIGSY